MLGIWERSKNSVLESCVCVTLCNVVGALSPLESYSVCVFAVLRASCVERCLYVCGRGVVTPCGASSPCVLSKFA